MNVYVPGDGQGERVAEPGRAEHRTATPPTTSSPVGRTTNSTPPLNVLPDTVNVIFWPAVPVNVRSAFSPIVVVVTVVGVPIAVVPVLSGTGDKQERHACRSAGRAGRSTNV